MSASKLIVVVGATGNQGGSVASVFLKESGWKVRALTRDASSNKSQALKAQGAEVVEANIDTPSTLSAAFEGANAIFAVSDYWGLYGNPANHGKAKPGQSQLAWAGEYEEQQLKNVIDAAAKVSTLERFVFSSLSNATKWSKGTYTHVYHFDHKAKAEEYGKRTYPELWAKTSIFQAGFFLSNFGFGGLSPPIKGVVQFIGHMNPEVKFPYIAAEEDTGPLVKALVQESAGKNLIAYREWLTPREIASNFTKATGVKAEAVALPRGVFPPEMPADLKVVFEENMGYWNEFGYEGKDDPTVIHPRDLKSPPSLGTVENYFKAFDWSKVLGS
ncbi:NAD(P)-binding protein [Pyrenochaeta sp. DS3sAY3a]|nr:NAD(P)-binding protein [Pyrenochaeta sp. DS3sAY3a]